jgi:hypothetical protein
MTLPDALAISVISPSGVLEGVAIVRVRHGPDYSLLVLGLIRDKGRLLKGQVNLSI